MYTEVSHVRSHLLHGMVFGSFQKLFVARGVVLQYFGTVAKAFGPFGPAAGGVLAFDRENR